MCARLGAWLHASKTHNVSKEHNVSAAWLNVSKAADLRFLKSQLSPGACLSEVIIIILEYALTLGARRG